MADLRPLANQSFVHTGDAMNAQLEAWDVATGYSVDILALVPPGVPEYGIAREYLFWQDLAGLDVTPQGDTRHAAMESLADKTFSVTNVGDLENQFWNGR